MRVDDALQQFVPSIMESINKNISEWLRGRGLTDDVITKSKLAWNGKEIVIPVFNEHGDFIFNKYRRNPSSQDGPKYRYEKGSTTALYNAHTLLYVGNNEPIFVCEGELDCLLLNSKGLHAVTSTGGSGTFKKDWAEFFTGKNIYIVFDRDEAGYRGAMKTQAILPFAKTIILPDEMEGNDVTDYFKNHTVEDFLSLEAIAYPIPREPSGIPADKKELKELVKAFGDACDALLLLKRDQQAKRKPVRHLVIFLQYTTTRYETFSHTLKSFERRYTGEKGNSTDVSKAKGVPITNFVKFSYDGFARCLWHDEKTGSMKYNGPGTKYPNTIKCFSCGVMADSIDLIMHMKNIGFGEAVKFLNSQ